MNVISINSGLQNKTVLSMSFDALNNLWLGLDNGIDCVHLSSPVSSLYGNKPVIGSGYSSIVYQVSCIWLPIRAFIQHYHPLN